MSSRKQATLYLRNSVPAAAHTEQQTVVGRLQALEKAGVIDDLTVETWPSRVTTPAAIGNQALAAYEGFTED